MSDSTTTGSHTPPQEPSQPGAAASARHPTADAHVYLIPEAELPPGFADRLEHADALVAEPRPAATVVLLRDSERGPEALLLRRPRRSRFAPDAWVFPGGVVDAEDRAPELVELLGGPKPAEWARRLELHDPATAFGYVVAALREAFEEVGVLFGRAPATRALPPMREQLAAARRALLNGERGFPEIVREQGLLDGAADLLYIAHWITPEAEPRRYDTRFFLALLGPDNALWTHAEDEGEALSIHEPELVEARWLTPGDAVARFRTAEVKMLPPTVHTLTRLAGFASVADARAALLGSAVPSILPRMRRHPDGVAIEFGPEA